MTSINNTNMQGVNAINANQTKQPAKVEAKAEEVKAKTMDQLKKDFEAGKLSAAEFKAEAAKIGTDVNVKTNKDTEKLVDGFNKVLQSKGSAKEKIAEIANLMEGVTPEQAANVLNNMGVNLDDPTPPLPETSIILIATLLIVGPSALGLGIWGLHKATADD